MFMIYESIKFFTCIKFFFVNRLATLLLITAAAAVYCFLAIIINYTICVITILWKCIFI